MEQHKAIVNMLEKDQDKLKTKMAQAMVYQKSIMKDQENMMNTINNKREEMMTRRDSAKRQLEPYLGKKEYDDKYDDLKQEYELCLNGLESLDQATTVCEESIAEAKLGMDRMDKAWGELNFGK